MVQRISGGHGSDQYEHDQSHAFLSVVGTVEEAHAGAGENEQAADIERRRFIAFWGAVKFFIFDERLCQQQ